MLKHNTRSGRTTRSGNGGSWVCVVWCCGWWCCARVAVARRLLAGLGRWLDGTSAAGCLVLLRCQAASCTTTSTGGLARPLHMAPLPPDRQGHSPRRDRMRTLNKHSRDKKGAGGKFCLGPLGAGRKRLGLGWTFCEWNNKRNSSARQPISRPRRPSLAMRMRTCQLTPAAQTGKTSRSAPHQSSWRAVPLGPFSPPIPLAFFLSSPVHSLSARLSSLPSPSQDGLSLLIASTLGSQAGLSFGHFHLCQLPVPSPQPRFSLLAQHLRASPDFLSPSSRTWPLHCHGEKCHQVIEISGI